MKRVAVISKNEYLVRKIELTLLGVASVTAMKAAPREHFDLCFWDRDSMGEPEGVENLMTMCRSGECDIKIPFEFKTLLDIFERTDAGAALVCEGRCAYLRGERIKLTELESVLLLKLISAGGEFVSRDEILRDVWNGAADAGIVNVYIHYLREKLEKGEKIIISSRSLGYKIDRRYL